MRYNYLDVARAILMSLGIVIHTAQVYAPEPWRVNGPESSPFFAYLIDLIHSFRMHSFYMIAGFFAAMLLCRYSVRDYLKTRFIRLGVPLLFCGLTINSLIHLLSYDNYQLGAEAFSASYWLGGDWLDHLWFLANLLVYLFLVAGAVKFFPGMLRYIQSLNIKFWHFYVVLPCAIFILERIAWRIPESPFGGAWLFVSISELFFYFPFFVLGFVFYLKQELFKKFVEAVPLGLVLVGVFAVAYWNDLGAGKYSYIYEVLKSLAVLGVITIVFSLFKRFFDGASQFVRAVSDASYTLYLVHPIIVLTAALYLAQFEMNVFFKFSLVVIWTWWLSYLFHRYVVERFWVALLVFNGKYEKPHSAVGAVR